MSATIGALNVNPHLHTLAADGVFEKVDGGGLRFHEAKAPSKDDIGELAKRMHNRAVKWLRRHHWLDERAAEDRGHEAAEPSALGACTQLALAGGTFVARPFEPRDNPDADLERKERRFSPRCDGFDVHCAVRIAVDDDAARKRLVRSCTRPPFALDRRAGSDRAFARWPGVVLAEGSAQGAHPPRHGADGAVGPACGADSSAQDPAGEIPRRLRAAFVVASAGDAEAAETGAWLLIEGDRCTAVHIGACA